MSETRRPDLDQVLRRLVHPLRVDPGKVVVLERDFDPGHKASFVDESDARELLQHTVRALAHYQTRLAAQRTDALLVVLQAMDAGGKDGVIKHVMTGVNPQGIAVHSFKPPTDEELRHDFLWRHQRVLPERGQIGIFNRSHYEEVVTVRVHPELMAREMPGAKHDQGVWQRRYAHINAWERHLAESGTHVVKLFLNVSRDEQRRRLLARIDDPHKNWKFALEDVRERARWADYQHAYSQMLSATSTDWAPWHVIPADHKWFSQLAAAGAIVGALARIDPHFPTPDAEHVRELKAARDELLND